jgi:hypothetical protein
MVPSCGAGSDFSSFNKGYLQAAQSQIMSQCAARSTTPNN